MKTRKRHDTGYPITATLKARGAPVNLTGATVSIIMKRGTTVTLNTECEVLDQTSYPGQVRYQFEEADVATSGVYLVEWQVSFTDGSIATFPNSQHEQLRIIDDLDNA